MLAIFSAPPTMSVTFRSSSTVGAHEAHPLIDLTDALDVGHQRVGGRLRPDNTLTTSAQHPRLAVGRAVQFDPIHERLSRPWGAIRRRLGALPFVARLPTSPRTHAR